MAFSERIKNFDKTRDYMRDFYIYGFKSRGEFSAKSARTYDDEKRRIESWLSPYIRWENGKKGKRISISLDTAAIGTNPLYQAWKAKSFTNNDITLHFALLSALAEGRQNIAVLTDCISRRTGIAFDAQTVRIKANEYLEEGLLFKEKEGKTDYYSLSSTVLSAAPVSCGQFLDAVRFFQEAAPFGFIGSTILDSTEAVNDLFIFKHHYIVHTLEDGVLFSLLQAIHEKRRVAVVMQSTRSSGQTRSVGVPLQIFVSVQSGRRYLCFYNERSRRFHNDRLDFIKKVELLEPYPDYLVLKEKLQKSKPFCWGVSFGGTSRKQQLKMKLFIDEEKEPYVLERIEREGRGGNVVRMEQNVFLYSVELYDTSEMMAWVKSFIGRILSLECSSREVVKSFYRDVSRMQEMYGGEN